MTIISRLHKKYLGLQFGFACVREAGSISGANEMLDCAIRTQDHLTNALAYSNPDLAGEGLMKSINDQIFSSDSAPMSLPALFRAQAQRIHHAERTHYNYAARPETKEDIKTQLSEATVDDLDEGQLNGLAEALLDLSFSMGDNCRNLGDALNALANTLEDLPPYIQNMALKPHLDLIKAHELVPDSLTL
jgi:hypothetical protein